MSNGTAPGLRESFDRLIEMTAEQRHMALTELDAQYPELAEELRKLLPTGGTSGEADDPVAERLLRSLDGAPPAHGQLGPYRLLHLLGVGGMGWVYLAERDADGVRQQVALKLVRGSGEAAANDLFQRERNVLASLQHPNIARFLDAGTVAGQPYLVMEYVEGQSLASWLEKRQPSLQQRLDLIVALARAVDHAHANLVVHRDLKPANLLVRGDDSPVLLDFGIAKLLDAEDANRVTSTRVYTPTYAAPEQIAGRPVTVATDVHALGLLLFELLCGEPSRVENEQAPRTRPGEVARASNVPWVRRGADAINVELDRIVAMALREEPERRYRSAADLAADIERWQHGLQVQAMPDTVRYRSRKWLRRHRWGVSVAAVAVVATAFFIVQLQSSLQRALVAEQEAQQKARTAQAVADLMTDLFSGADPRVARNADVSARALLERGAERLTTHRSGDAGIDAQLRLTMGVLLAGIGDPAAAVSQFDAGLAAQPPDPLMRAELLHERARSLTRQKDNVEAEASARQALALREASLGPDAPAVGHALNSLGVALQDQDRDVEAEASFLRAEAIFAAQQPPDLEALASSRHNMGRVAQKRGDLDLAIRRFRQAIEDKTSFYGADDPRTLLTMMVLGQALGSSGDYDQAIEWLQRAVEGRRKAHGDRSLETATALNELAFHLHGQGNLAQAQAHYLEALEITRRVDPNSADAAILLNNLGALRELRGDLEGAERDIRTSVQLREQLYGTEHLNTLRAAHNLCRVLTAQNKLVEARACAHDVFERRRNLLGEAHPEADDSRAVVEGLSADPDRAWLIDRYERFNQQGASQVTRTMRFAWLLASSGGDADDIERMTKMAQSLREYQGANSMRAALTELHLADLAMRIGQADLAREALARGEAVLDAGLVPQAPARTLWKSLQARLVQAGPAP
ncbi:MAG: serine/threonine protein kinase [Xanthomonadales bacterium]|nr:serine/threonine protein kinase [Xanthomonadales bacterium]